MVPDLLERGHESAHGHHHGYIPGAVGLLRIADRLAPSDCLERHRAVLINFGTTGAYAYYFRREKQAQAAGVK